MTVREFEFRLRSKLHQMTPEDREEALEYYHEIFQEMHLNTEDEVPEAYRDIRRIAYEIKRDYVQMELEQDPPQRRKKEWTLILLGLLALPVGIPVLFALFVLAIVLISFLFASVVSVCASIVALFVVGFSNLWKSLILIGVLLISMAVILIVVGLVGILKNFILRKLNDRKRDHDEF